MPAAAFAAEWQRLWPAAERTGLAVSGGPDSLALLLLAEAVLGADRFAVATVDHGLRAQSADEAAFVARLCAARGIAHHTLTLSLPSGPAVQERARDARYRALAGWCHEQGLAALVTAHHADDQAETLVMRITGAPVCADWRGFDRARWCRGIVCRCCGPCLAGAAPVWWRWWQRRGLPQSMIRPTATAGLNGRGCGPGWPRHRGSILPGWRPVPVIWRRRTPRWTGWRTGSVPIWPIRISARISARILPLISQLPAICPARWPCACWNGWLCGWAAARRAGAIWRAGTTG